MNKSLLDTDILSEIIKNINQEVISRSIEYRAFFNFYTISVISVMEIVKGLHKMGREKKIQEFLARLNHTEVLFIDTQTAVLAGKIYGELEKEGKTVGKCDPMIAATAISHDLTLISGNTGHYQRIVYLGYPLILENWKK